MRTESAAIDKRWPGPKAGGVDTGSPPGAERPRRRRHDGVAPVCTRRSRVLGGRAGLGGAWQLLPPSPRSQACRPPASLPLPLPPPLLTHPQPWVGFIRHKGASKCGRRPAAHSLGWYPRPDASGTLGCAPHPAGSASRSALRGAALAQARSAGPISVPGGHSGSHGGGRQGVHKRLLRAGNVRIPESLTDSVQNGPSTSPRSPRGDARAAAPPDVPSVLLGPPGHRTSTGLRGGMQVPASLPSAKGWPPSPLPLRRPSPLWHRRMD